MDATTAHRTWRSLEPIHGAIYFVPEASAAYQALGYEHPMAGYFASRAAPMGAVGAEVVTATFFNFDAGLVRKSMDGAWDIASPAAVSQARLEAADAMLRRVAGETLGDLDAAAGPLREAALAAVEHPEGRPLFAGHADLDWPDEPHLVVWHAQTLLREFRGDGHIAVLTAEGLNGCEALVSHASMGEISSEALKATRKRSDDDWAAATESLQRRGWLDADGEVTDEGRAARQRIEERTDELAVIPYAAIGEEACAELRATCRPTSAAMATALGFRGSKPS